jgi:ABC-type lipoprotein release transport system permease subunit
MEIGILRANGFGRDGIAALFASRSLFASCVGAVAGFAAGLLFVGFPGLWWSVCWFMVCLSVALAIALVAGVLPALRALSVDPAAVLQSEY